MRKAIIKLMCGKWYAVGYTDDLNRVFWVKSYYDGEYTYTLDYAHAKLFRQATALTHRQHLQSWLNIGLL